MTEPTENGSVEIGTAGQSEPLFFGQIGHELFGWLHHPAKQHLKRTGVVLCGTLGPESLPTHRALRRLADSLAETGIRTVRFDYTGTGDSVDLPGSPFRLATCIDNVRTAIHAVRAQSAVERIIVVGLRLGGLFAMKAAELEEVDALVLWGPVVAGRRFVREWTMLASRSDAPKDLANDGMVHAAGFSLDRMFLDELAGCSLLQARPLGAPCCLIVEREELSPEDKLLDRLKEWGLNVHRCRPGGFLTAMVLEPHLTETPVAAIRAIQEWIADTDGALPKPELIPPQPAFRFLKTVVLPHQNPENNIRVCERFLDLSATGGLFGVVTEPVNQKDWNGQCVIFLNAGSVHHIGTNRMHVYVSRRMAAQGSRVCRADLHGLGDSPVRPGARENDPYPAGAVDDVSRIIQAFRAGGQCTRIALVGLCSGAWASFHAALEIDGITDIVLINPDFYGERSVVGKPASFVRPKEYSHYKLSARSWAKWRKLLMGRSNLAKIVRVLSNQAMVTLASFRLRVAGEHHQLDKDLTRLATLGVRVGFIFSPGDGGVDFLSRNGRVGLKQLTRSGLVRHITISGADHPFSLPGSQRRLADTLSEWLR
jgi:pimeloyl-ACP methyl ester carboxylesterase